MRNIDIRHRGRSRRIGSELLVFIYCIFIFFCIRYSRNSPRGRDRLGGQVSLRGGGIQGSLILLLFLAPDTQLSRGKKVNWTVQLWIHFVVVAAFHLYTADKRELRWPALFRIYFIMLKEIDGVNKIDVNYSTFLFIEMHFFDSFEGETGREGPVSDE